jgi:hypothetical protein
MTFRLGTIPFLGYHSSSNQIVFDVSQFSSQSLFVVLAQKKQNLLFAFILTDGSAQLEFVTIGSFSRSGFGLSGCCQICD